MSGDHYPGRVKAVLWIGGGIAAWAAVMTVVLIVRWFT
jgi:hypothetical protein